MRATSLHFSLALLCITALLAPSNVSATDGGFPSQALWLSRAEPASGEKIEISTVIYNASAADFSGKVVFLVDGSVIESKEATLQPGRAAIVSASWRATAGEHTFGAKFMASGPSGEINQESGTMRLAIAEPPPPSQAARAFSTAATAITSIASSSTPALSGIASAAYTAIESLRESGIAMLEKRGETRSLQAPATQSPDTENRGAAAAVSGFTPETAPSAKQPLSWRASQIAAAAALITLRSKAIFYPLLILSIALALYLLFRWALRRPSTHTRTNTPNVRL